MNSLACFYRAGSSCSMIFLPVWPLLGCERLLSQFFIQCFLCACCGYRVTALYSSPMAYRCFLQIIFWGSYKVFLSNVKQLSSSSLHYFNCCLVKFSFKENRFFGGLNLSNLSSKQTPWSCSGLKLSEFTYLICKLIKTVSREIKMLCNVFSLNCLDFRCESIYINIQHFQIPIYTLIIKSASNCTQIRGWRKSFDTLYQFSHGYLHVLRINICDGGSICLKTNSCTIYSTLPLSGFSSQKFDRLT